MTILPESSPAAPRRARRPRISRALVAVVVVLLAAGGTGAWYLTRSTTPVQGHTRYAKFPLGQPQPTTAAQWLAAAHAAMLASDSVHMNIVDRAGGHSITYNDDDARSSGRQLITPGPGLHAEVRVIGRATYFTGNTATLERFFGIPANEAARLGGQWLALRPGDADYQTVTEGVTISSVLGQLEVPTPVTLLPERVMNGVHVIGVRGTGPEPHAKGPVTTTMWIDVTTKRPVRYEGSGNGATETVTFSRWDVPLKVVAPTGDVWTPGGTTTT